MIDLDGLLDRLDTHNGFKLLAENSDVVGSIDSFILGAEKVALTLDGKTDKDRYEALIAISVFKKIKGGLNRAATNAKNTEAKIKKLQTSKESI